MNELFENGMSLPILMLLLLGGKGFGGFGTEFGPRCGGGECDNGISGLLPLLLLMTMSGGSGKCSICG